MGPDSEFSGDFGERRPYFKDALRTIKPSDRVLILGSGRKLVLENELVRHGVSDITSVDIQAPGPFLGGEFVMSRFSWISMIGTRL